MAEGATHVDNFVNKRKFGFTLAEVLITLGIIGVVAALTLPAVVSNYKKNVLETRLKKVYSVLSQALVMSESVNGFHDEWDYGDIEHHRQADIMEEWWNKYLASYIPSDKIKQVITGDTSKSGKDSYTVVLKDGSAIKLAALPGTYAWFYIYPKYKESNAVVGKDVFGVFTYKSSNVILQTAKEVKKKNNAELISSCNKLNSLTGYCLELIMRNSWKIPKDYPIKL